MIYEVYDKFNEHRFNVLNVEKVIETKYDFKFKYNNGTYSCNYSKQSNQLLQICFFLPNNLPSKVLIDLGNWCFLNRILCP